MRAILVLIAIVLFFGIGIYIDQQIWSECRTDHSFWYCLRLISR